MIARALLILALLVASTLARSDGIYNPTSNEIGFTDGINNLAIGTSVPQPTGDVLMVDGVSLILQTDAASFVCRAGGC
jgi:hypothetical protein